MRAGGRIAAAIEIIDDFDERRVPIKTAISEWARSHRFAGAKDRAWISGLCLDVLRRRRTLSLVMEDEGARAGVLAALRYLWRMSCTEIADAAGDEHGPGTLSEADISFLSQTRVCDLFTADDNAGAPADYSSDMSVAGDYPAWLDNSVRRVFDDPVAEGRALAQRAPVDLRTNLLKTDLERASAALSKIKARPSAVLSSALRVDAARADEKGPALTVIPAFNKGWVEVQDLGSQIAAAAAGNIAGAQVMDYCAGGGGKTLALAAMMKNTGQLFAYDVNARRLAPLYARAKRAGLRNLQVLQEATALDTLKANMDVVFVDAPCTGTGTWRRRPDTKWRLTERQLTRRIAEQDKVLREAARYVKPGGRLIWATCSFLAEENEDRLASFVNEYPEFEQASALPSILASGLATPQTETMLKPCETDSGALRLTPRRVGTDGFFVAVLVRRSDAD